MLALVLAALLGLVRLIWAPADSVLLLVDWGLFVVGLARLSIGGAHDPAAK